MEACASAHYWGREILQLGHEVKLIPPIYVKPFVKRQKNDTADAEAICEAAQRPTMRFVAVKTEEQQARGMLFRTRLRRVAGDRYEADQRRVLYRILCVSRPRSSRPPARIDPRTGWRTGAWQHAILSGVFATWQ